VSKRNRNTEQAEPVEITGQDVAQAEAEPEVAQPSINPSILALAEKLQAKAELDMAKRKSELAAKYPHALVDTIRQLPHGTSGHLAYAVDVRCTVTGEVFGPVFTSDLFQINTCPRIRKEAKAVAKASQKAEIKEAMAFLAKQKSGQ
jgi:hypothetical protein